MLMTDQYGSPWPDAPPNPTSFLQPPASVGYPPPPGYLVPPPRTDYASWGRRVRARLIDQIPTYLGLIICSVGYLILIVQLAVSDGSTLYLRKALVTIIIGLGIVLASLVWTAYNRWLTAGRTGRSLGKRVAKINLIGEETNAPIGAKNAFIRDLVHILDALTLVGYLWPLWDDRRQTFADQLMKTIVINDTAETAVP
jgi:uncharacterized RDD family membrane protein YckC